MIQSFIIALITGFIGTMPVGVLNTTSAKIAVEQRFDKVLWFGLGAVLVEYFQAYLAFYIADWLGLHKEFSSYVNIVAVPLFALIGWYYFRLKVKEESKETVLGHFFRKGILLSIINPLAIPFWAFNITVFKSNFHLEFDHLQFYLFGGVAGTWITLTLYGVLGRVLRKKLIVYENYFNKILAFVFWGVAGFLLIVKVLNVFS